MSTAGSSHPRRRRLGFLAQRGAILVGLLIPLGWDEIQPRALRESATAAARGDLRRSVGLALQHLSRHPWSRTAALTVARGFSQLDYADWAEPYYHQIGPARLDLNDQQTRALGLFRANRRDEAVIAFDAILDRHPANILALRRLAAVRIAQSEYAEALALADRLIAAPGGAVIGHTLAGTIHHDLGDTEHAVADLLAVLTLDPTLVEMPLTPRSTFWTYLGQDLLTEGRADEARIHLEHALTEGENSALASILAASCRQLGDLDAAERWWRAALGWKSDIPGAWLGLGRLALQRGHPGQAIDPLNRASELSPRDPAPVYSLSLAHRQLGDKAEADRFQTRADQLRDANGSSTTGTMTTTPAPTRLTTPAPIDPKLEPR